jgi:hypothetical protein
MTQLNKSIATKLAAKLEAYDATLDSHESQLADLLAFTKQHHVDREHVAYAITCFVSRKYGVPMNDKHQLVKATEGKAATAWGAARKRKSRLLASIYAEAKPRTSNKVDRVEKMLKDFRAMSKAEQRRFMERI